MAEEKVKTICINLYSVTLLVHALIKLLEERWQTASSVVHSEYVDRLWLVTASELSSVCPCLEMIPV